MIETAKPDQLMAQLSDECPEAPVASLRRALMRAVKEFAETGLVAPWITIPTQACVASYPLERYVCEGMEIKFIRNVEWCGDCYDCVEECKGCQTGYRMDDLHHITLVGSIVPQSSGTSDLRVQAVLRVKNDNCEIPKDMLDEYEETLFDGAMSFLLKQKGKPWSDFRLASYYQNEFRGKKANAKCNVQNKHNDCDQEIRPRRMV